MQSRVRKILKVNSRQKLYQVFQNLGVERISLLLENSDI